MKKEALYTIGSHLKHSSGVIIKLQRYGTQLVQSLRLSNGPKSTPNYNYLYGTQVDTNKAFEGLTKEFELLNPQ